MGFKKCSKCKQELPETTQFFNKSSRTKSGFWCYCKPCDALRVSEWKAKNAEKVRANKREWAAKNPDLVKQYRKKVQLVHKDRYAEQRRARYATDPVFRAYQRAATDCAFEKYGDKYKLKFWAYNQNPEIKKRNVMRAKEWALANPDRVRAHIENRRSRKQSAPGNFDANDLMQLLDKQQNMCCYCGCDMAGKHTIDHLVPLSKGGTNWPSNLALACRPCNSRKGTKTVEEFFQFMAQRHNVNQLGVKNG